LRVRYPGTRLWLANFWLNSRMVSWDSLVVAFLNSSKIILLSQPGKHLDIYNTDVQKLSSRLETEQEKSKEYLIDEGKLSEADKAITHGIVRHYALSDTLALRYQKYAILTWRLLFILAIFAVLSFGIYAHIFPDNKLGLLMYLIILGIGFAIYIVAKYKEYHDRHLEYRALAEALRIQFFWILSGISNYVADYYLLKQRTELDWTRRALRNIRFLSFRQSNSSLKTIQAVWEDWVDDQKNYFMDKIEK